MIIHRHLALRVGLAVGAALCLAGTAVADGVQIKTLEDGTRLVYNENQAQRARRTSSRLVPIPKGSGLEPLIRRHALQQGLSPRLVQSVVQVESGYNPRALSNKGAIGLMQLMPGTARLLGVSDPWDPEQNIQGGTRYLREQLDRFSGSLELALAAYNAGPTAVTRFGGIPPYRETERYVKKVLSLYHRNPPRALQEHARDRARLRKEQESLRRSREPERAGGKVYVTRDQNNRIVVTTIPPKSP
ncbi:MAG: lytic transglycosylase domain-containing protein [Acidobacteriota bacterium]